MIIGKAVINFLKYMVGLEGRNRTSTLFSKEAMNSSIQKIILQS